MSDLEYVKMLEIPINSCDVTVKSTRRKKKDVKKQVIEKVNSNVEVDEKVQEKPIKKEKIAKAKIEKKPFYKFMKTRDKKVKEKPTKKKNINSEPSVEIKSSGFDIVSVQVVAIFILIVGIILTNIFWEDSGINNLMRSVFNDNTTLLDVSYSDFSASLPSKTDEVLLENGVMTVKKGSVYSPCDGVVESVVENDGLFTVTILHSESFSTVISGLESVYVSKNDKVFANIPLGYSEGSSCVSMFDGDAILTGYVLSDSQIVWLG